MFRQMIQMGVLLVCLAFSANAFAESVVLLATDGEGESKVLVDKILAEQLESNPDYALQPPRQIGISDLIFGAGCEKPDVACMEQLKALIESDRLVFAIVGETISVRIYDFKEKRFIAETGEVNIGDEDSIRAQIQSFLLGKSGELFVDVGPENAEIFLDGESMGISPQTLQNLALGKHTVLIRSSDGQEQTRKVVLEAGKVERLSFTVKPMDSGESSKIVKLLPGIGVIALGVAGIGFGITQSLTVQGFKDDLAEQESTDPAFADGKISDGEQIGARWFEIHQEAKDSSAETLQWVGYGIGVVGVGLGSYLLFSAMGDSAEVSISPNPSQPSASVKLKF